MAARPHCSGHLARAADLAPLAPGIPPDAVSAVMKALSRDPTKRFATCTEFAKSFQQALGVPTMQVFPREFAAAMRRRRWLRVGVAAGALPRRFIPRKDPPNCHRLIYLMTS